MALWNKEVFGSVQGSIRQKQDELRNLFEKAIHYDVANEIKVCCKELFDLQDSEEKLWRQRSRVASLKEEDCNIRFFQYCLANKRKRRNMILEIKDDNGTIYSSNAEIGQSFISISLDYFKVLEYLILLWLVILYLTICLLMRSFLLISCILILMLKQQLIICIFRKLLDGWYDSCFL